VGLEDYKLLEGSGRGLFQRIVLVFVKKEQGKSWKPSGRILGNLTDIWNGFDKISFWQRFL